MKYFALVICLFILGADAAPHMNIKICGDDEIYCSDVSNVNGVKRLATDSIVTVEQVFGQDPHATSWFYFGTAPDAAEDADGIGAAGDTVRIQIPGAVTPLGTIYPAVDVTTTVSSACTLDDNPERCVALDVCLDLEGDANFISASWKCVVIKDHSGVFIESRLYNEFGERTSWTVTTTGTTYIVKAFDEIKRRGLPTELSRSPNDPRQGILGIAGTVTSIPGGVGDILIEEFQDTGMSSDMRVDGSTTPVDFRIECDADEEKLINEVRIFGGCNGIKFGQFLCKNTFLTNGIQFELRSEGQTLTFPFTFKTTEDFKNKFAFGPSGAGSTFRIDVQAGGDQFIASFIFSQPAIIRKCGAVPSPNDYMEFTVQDNLTGSQGGNLNELVSLAQGFKQEP